MGIGSLILVSQHKICYRSITKIYTHGVFLKSYFEHLKIKNIDMINFFLVVTYEILSLSWTNDSIQ